RVLQQEYSDKFDEEGQRLLNILRSNAATMGELIDGLLKFSHLGRQPLEQSDIDMKELVSSAFDEVQDREKNRVELRIHSLPPAFGDRNMIRQALLALLSNSFKFTRPKADAVVEVDHKETIGRQHVYSIRDNGVGFDMQYSDKLFGVFQRLHGADEFEGT